MTIVGICSYHTEQEEYHIRSGHMKLRTEKPIFGSFYFIYFIHVTLYNNHNVVSTILYIFAKSAETSDKLYHKANDSFEVFAD